MKKRTGMLVITIVCVFLVIFLAIGNPIIFYHNQQLKRSITSLEDNQKVTLNEIVPFDWEIVYTFAPYTSREEIEEIIGFDSDSISETISEGMVQLLFVKGKTVTASVCGYPSKLGYSVTNLEGSVSAKEEAVFLTDTDSGIVKLIKQ